MNEVRLALRQCLRRPGLSLAAVLSLALGIGANTAIFTVLNGSVLQPLPYRDPDRLVVVWETARANDRRSVAPANFIDWRRDTTSFSGLAAFDDFSATLTGRGEAERVRAVSASANFFEVLGVQAAVGRVPIPKEDDPGTSPVAVLTDGFWHRLFGGSPSAIGSPLIINGIAHTVIGVLPASFDLPMTPGAEVWVTGDRGIPRSFPFPGDIASVRDSHMIAVIGRLADGVSLERAQADVASVMADLRPAIPPPTPDSARTSGRYMRRSSAPSARSSCCCRERSRCCCSSRAPTSRTCSSVRRPGARPKWQCAWRLAPIAGGSSGSC